ncbi:MAG: spermidine/putrescine ABC transporter ATP-binding protein [Rhodospirillaceae bacterium]|nr:spermidine/putrescine ABC transporter ATP-binding protein [Rhodospirillaceae bacterium]MDG1886067.1 ABC transporter ATP-binding protein [Alphaproteobacteria bacterium]
MKIDNNPLVEFVDVQKTYDGEELVVKNLNLKIMPGEFLTMLGPSGSGKTTCLMMIAGFEAPTHGKVMLGDIELNDVPPHKRGIGMVFQNYALFPHMSVFENLAFPLEVRKIGKNETEKKVMRALDMVELGQFGARRPAQLSGGQQQRVALARALVFEPDLVLMDEPLGALDKNLREQMQYEIKHIHENLGMTVVYVTHDQSEALTMSDRIAVFNDGVVQQLASPADLYERPENAFVAEFIGENNRLSGEVKSVDGSTCIVDVAGQPILALNVNGQKMGGSCILSLRPERITLNPELGRHPNIFDAKILELIYLGDHIRCRMSVCSNDNFIVKVPNTKLDLSLKEGGAVRVGWYTDDCRALEA